MFETLHKIIKFIIWVFWRILFVIVGAILFFTAWFWPMLYFEKESIFSDAWIISFAFVVFYGIAIWHVVSEDERRVSVWTKIRQGLLASFNKMLFAFLIFSTYIIMMGAIAEEW